MIQRLRPAGLLAIAIIAAAGPRTGFAQGEEGKPVKVSWELTPYRVEICVVVERSARLAAGLERELSEQLVAQAEATFGGPWIVSANQKEVANKSRFLRQVANADERPASNAGAQIDKLIVIGVREQASALQVTAREFDVPTNLWNTPVSRSVLQLSRLPMEAFGALQAAWSPVLRIDTVDKETVGVTLRAGSLPKRDGSYLSLDRSLPFSVLTIQIDKEGKPKTDSITPLPWTFLLPLSAPGSAVTASTSRATFKCRLHTALGGSPIPDYHPLQARLAVAIPKSTAGTRLMLLDQESPGAPLEGYEVFLGPVESTPSSSGPEKVGVTNRSGELEIPAGDGALRRLIVSHGGEALVNRPYLPGLKGELKISLANDRRRLELAAEIASAQDELTDTLGRLAVLGARAQDGVTRRDLSAVNRATAELKNVATLTALRNRVTALESKLAAADEVTRSRLAPAIAQFKTSVEALHAGLAAAR
jgi:hypothetical protein